MAARNALNISHDLAQRPGHKTPLRSRQPVPISSHPEADPEAAVAQDIPLNSQGEEEFRRGPDAERVKPIVSINGSDIEEEADCDAA